MKPKALKLLRESNKRLHTDRLSNYRQLMLLLCRDHSSFEPTRRIRPLIEASDWLGLLDLADSLSKQKYDNPRQHFLGNQFSLLIRKYPFGSIPGLDPESRALEKFLAAEHRCKRVNQRFVAMRKRSPHEGILSEMRSWIAYVLGDPDVSAILDEGGFGPGANVGVGGNATNVARKLLSENWSVTPGAFSLGFNAFSRHAQILPLLLGRAQQIAPETGVHHAYYCHDEEAAWLRYTEKSVITKHNKIVFVPKTTKVHRTIAVEPLVNSYIQKGIDLVMRKRLKRVGIDLSSQAVNQEMARQGSLVDDDSSFVTIDLSSASDSVSLEVVRTLLPPDWFALLNACRSRFGQISNIGEIQYQKFCSMGNGFCFPLETLIFAAACHATKCGVPGSDFAVYGDDIAVRKRHSANLLEVLELLGFCINTEKTFLFGPFRESCGCDWFGGNDVRPFTLDFELDCISSLFKFLNLTRRNSLASEFFEGIRDFVLSLVPPLFLYWRPFTGNPDTAIDCVGDEYLTSPHVRWNKNLWTWSWHELDSVPVVDHWVRYQGQYDIVLMYGALFGSDSVQPFTLRRKVKTKVRVKSHSETISQWLPPETLVGQLGLGTLR